MQFLTKKSDAQPEAAPLWHTNFRNFDRLPDTKVVRTTFFINTAAIAFTMSMLLWLGQREYTIYDLGEQKAAAQRQIDTNQKDNAAALKLSKTFLDEQKKVSEVLTFLKAPVTPAEFINLISQSLPKSIEIDFAETRNTSDAKSSIYQIRGRTAGSPDQASGITSSYVDMLRAHEKLGRIFDPITLIRLDRGAAGDFMTFDISLTVRAEKK